MLKFAETLVAGPGGFIPSKNFFWSRPSRQEGRGRPLKASKKLGKKIFEIFSGLKVLAPEMPYLNFFQKRNIRSRATCVQSFKKGQYGLENVKKIRRDRKILKKLARGGLGPPEPPHRGNGEILIFGHATGIQVLSKFSRMTFLAFNGLEF